MSEHVHGEMDTVTQEKTFEGFIRIGIWSAVIVTLILVFLAIVAV